MNKELSSIMDDASLFKQDNSFISKNNTQVLIGLANQLDFNNKDTSNIDQRNNQLLQRRYTSRQLFTDKDFDSLGSIGGSNDRLQNSEHPNNKSIEKLKST